MTTRPYDSASRPASVRTSSAIRPGWLCSRGGSGCTSTGQPRRSTTAAAGWAMAPQATSATRSGPERQLLDEGVVEVGAVGELDILHLLQQRQRAGPFAHGQQGHLRALAGDVAG